MNTLRSIDIISPWINKEPKGSSIPRFKDLWVDKEHAVSHSKMYGPNKVPAGQ